MGKIVPSAEVEKKDNTTTVVIKDTEKVGKGFLVWFFSQSISSKILMIMGLLILIAFISVFVFGKESTLINMLRHTTADSVSKQEDLINQMHDQNIDLKKQVDNKNKQLLDSQKLVNKLKGELREKENESQKIKIPATDEESIQRLKALGYDVKIKKDIKRRK
jgi:hypothetical protein